MAAVLLALVPAACGEGEDPGVPSVDIHAHRGGPLASEDGKQVPVHPENSMSAFRAAHADAFTIELDVKLTADSVPVVIHDPTLERTTDCAGRVDARSARSLSRCRLDVLGTGEVTALNPRPEAVPTLAEVLGWARAAGANLNLEIKNLPTNEDFDRTAHFARVVVKALDGSGIPPEQVLVQSFWAPNLDVAHAAGWRTALLTGRDRNRDAPDLARRHAVDVLSPEWPLPEGFLERAGAPVLPWTLNSRAEIRAALDAGVDGIVSDDPGLVRELSDAG